MDVDTGRAAQRRRKQVVWLLTGALALIAVAMGLMWIAYKSAPQEIDEDSARQAASLHANSRAYHPTVGFPRSHRIFPENDAAPPAPTVAQTPPAPAVPLPAPSPVIVQPVFPALITLATAIDKPNVGNGIGDRTQRWPLRAADIDAPGTVTGIRWHLATTRDGAGEAGNLQHPAFCTKASCRAVYARLPPRANSRPGSRPAMEGRQ